MNKQTDIERIRHIQKTSLEMMTALHRGLSRIAKGKMSSGQMRQLAIQTLDEVQNIATNPEKSDA